MLNRLFSLLRPATPAATPARDWPAHFAYLQRIGYNFRIDGDRMLLIAYPGLRAQIGMPSRRYDLRTLPARSLSGLTDKRTPART